MGNIIYDNDYSECVTYKSVRNQEQEAQLDANGKGS